MGSKQYKDKIYEKKPKWDDEGNRNTFYIRK